MTLPSFAWVGLNDGYNDDGVFSPGSTEVANTVASYNTMFHAEYPINSADDSAGVPGILYGESRTRQ